MYFLPILMFYLIFIGAAFFINYLVAKKFEAIAFQKGYNESIHSFAMCFWLGVVGYLYVIALPNLKELVYRDSEFKSSNGEAEGTKRADTIQHYQCPTCKQNIAYGIEKCPSCGQILEWKR